MGNERDEDSTEAFLRRADVGLAIAALSDEERRLGNRWLGFLSLCACVLLVTIAEGSRRSDARIFAMAREGEMRAQQVRCDAWLRFLGLLELTHASAKAEAAHLAVRHRLLTALLPAIDGAADQALVDFQRYEARRAERREPLKLVARKAVADAESVWAEWEKQFPVATSATYRIPTIDPVLTKRLTDAQALSVSSVEDLLDVKSALPAKTPLTRESLADHVMRTHQESERASNQQELLRIHVERSERRYAEERRTLDRMRNSAPPPAPSGVTFPILGVSIPLNHYITTFFVAVLIGLGFLVSTYRACLALAIRLLMLADDQGIVRAVATAIPATLSLTTKRTMIWRLAVPGTAAAISTGTIRAVFPEISITMAIAFVAIPLSLLGMGAAVIWRSLGRIEELAG